MGRAARQHTKDKARGNLGGFFSLLLEISQQPLPCLALVCCRSIRGKGKKRNLVLQQVRHGLQAGGTYGEDTVTALPGKGAIICPLTVEPLMGGYF